MTRTYPFLLAIFIVAACDDGPTGPSTPIGKLLRDEPDERHRQSGRSDRSGRHVPTTRHRWRTRGAPGARISASSGTRELSNQVTHAKDRIGQGPWYNVNLQLIANNLAELHSRTGDAALFLDERGRRINGQWTGSPTPNEHDILTGSNADGTLASGLTCADWTSDSASAIGQVGHSDGMGPGQSTAGALSSWNSSHTNQNCANTAPRGGAGRLYCFAVD